MNNLIRNGWTTFRGDASLSYAPGASEIVRDHALSGLVGSSVADRFRAWTGRSGRRYVFSVFPIVGPPADLDHLPLVDESVALGVQRSGSGTRTVLWAAGTGDCPVTFLESDRMRALHALGRCELHLHLLAGSRDERRTVLADLAV